MWIWGVVVVPAAAALLAARRPASGLTAVRTAVALTGVILAVAWIGGATGTGLGPVWLAAGELTLRAGLRVDALAGLVGMASIVAALLALGAGTRAAAVGRGPALVAVALAAHLVVLLADSLWLLLIGWEAAGICASWMLDVGSSRAGGRGRAALLTSRAGSLALLLASGILLHQTGTLRIGRLVETFAEPGPSADPAGLAVSILVLIAVAGRAGLVPMHGWLVRGAGAPGALGALHAGVTWTSAIYVLARLRPLLARSPTGLALGAGLGVVTALSLFLAACLVPRRRMPGLVVPAHAGLLVAGICCGDGAGAVVWTAALGPLLVAVALLSPGDPRDGHAAAVLGALVAVLWIGLPGVGPTALLRSRTLAALAVPPLGGAPLAGGAMLAVAAAAIAAVRWLSGGRGAPRVRPTRLWHAAVALIVLLVAGVPMLFGPDLGARAVTAIEPLVTSLRDLRGLGRARVWLLAPGLAALAGALLAASMRVASGWVERIESSAAGRRLRLAASRGWYVHATLRALLLRPVVLLAGILGAGDQEGFLPTMARSGRPRPRDARGVYAGLLALLMAGGTLWRTVAATGDAIPGMDGVVASALLAVTGLGILGTRAERRTAWPAIVGGIALAMAALLPPAADWIAWWSAAGALVFAARRSRLRVALNLLAGVALLTVAAAGAPPVIDALPARAAPPGWRLLMLALAALLLAGSMPFQAWRARTSATLPPAAAILLAAGWPLAALHALMRHAASLDAAGWETVAAWLPGLGAALIALSGPAALAQGGPRGLATRVHGATIGWALLALGTWTRLSLTGALLLLIAHALWLTGWLVSAGRGAARNGAATLPGSGGRALARWGPLHAAAAYPGLLLIVVDSHRAAPQATLIALIATLVLALPVREFVTRTGGPGASIGAGRVSLWLVTLLTVMTAVWPALLSRPLSRDLKRNLVPTVPFRPADPEISAPDRVADASGSGNARAFPPESPQPSRWRKKNSRLAGRSASRRMNQGYQAGP